MKASTQFREANAVRERVRGVLQNHGATGGHVMIHSLGEFGGKHVVLYHVETATYRHARCAILDMKTLQIENSVIVSQER